MKCLLMNKNIEVLYAEYDDFLARFDKIYEVINIDYAPLILKKCYAYDNDLLDLLKMLEKWFKNRGIPNFRDKLDVLLNQLNVSTSDELLNKSFGLSLSDQYWLKPIELNIDYDDINFFTNEFENVDFLDISFNTNTKIKFDESVLKTPNNTTDGMLRKAWIIENGNRVLVKGGYKNDNLQPFNEVLASMICDRLGFYHMPYYIDVYKNNVVSKCLCFINQNTEFIPASQIRYDMKKYNSIKDFDDYIDILESNEIKNARIKLENMYILDYLIMNEDRHLNNFGVIRDVNTLKWLDVAPIFDNGQSLNIDYYNDDEIAVRNEGRFFYNFQSFDEIIKVVKNIKRIDIKKLDGVVKEFDILLHKYQDITHMSDKRIHMLCVLLNRQIDKLRELVNH